MRRTTELRSRGVLPCCAFARGAALSLLLGACSSMRAHAPRERSPQAAVSRATAEVSQALSEPARGAHGDAGAPERAAARVEARVLPGVVRGLLRDTLGDERCELEDGGAAHFAPDRPLFTLRAADVQGTTRAWVRSNGRATVVLVFEVDDDGPGTDCAEAERDGARAEVSLPTERWSTVRVYAATRTGESGPFVAGLRAASSTEPNETAEPIAPAARDEARAFWRLREHPSCEAEQPCAVQELVIESAGAPDRVLASELGFASTRCHASPIPSGASLFGFVCLGGGTYSVDVARVRGRLLERASHESDGSCDGPCRLHTRTLHTITLPPRTRLVAHPRGVLSWAR